MTDRLSKPIFFGESYNPKIDPSFTEGSVTSVRYLEDLPPNLLERIPELEGSKSGYVLKQYNKNFGPNFSKHDITIFDQKTNRLTSSDPKDFTLVDKTMILKKRKDEITRYFRSEASEMIVQSKFFIAKNQDDEFDLYEIQNKLDDYYTLDKLNSIEFNKMDKLTKKTLILELTKLQEILSKLLIEKEDPIFKTFIPDIHPGNIGITNDGHVKIFDTNFWGFQWSSLVPSKIESSIKLITILINKLKNSLNQE